MRATYSKGRRGDLREDGVQQEAPHCERVERSRKPGRAFEENRGKTEGRSRKVAPSVFLHEGFLSYQRANRSRKAEAMKTERLATPVPARMELGAAQRWTEGHRERITAIA